MHYLGSYGSPREWMDGGRRKRTRRRRRWRWGGLFVGRGKFQRKNRKYSGAQHVRWCRKGSAFTLPHSTHRTRGDKNRGSNAGQWGVRTVMSMCRAESPHAASHVCVPLPRALHSEDGQQEVQSCRMEGVPRKMPWLSNTLRRNSLLREHCCKSIYKAWRKLQGRTVTSRT